MDEYFWNKLPNINWDYFLFQKADQSEVRPRICGSFSVAFNITYSSRFHFYDIDERKWEFISFYDIFLCHLFVYMEWARFCGRKREKFYLIIYNIRHLNNPYFPPKNHAPCSKLLYWGQFALSIWETNFSKIENRSYITASRLNGQ